MVLFSCSVVFAHPEGHAGMVHLKFNNGKIHAHCKWQKGPAVGHDSVLQIEWKNGTNHNPVDPVGTVTVGLNPATSPSVQIKPVLDEQGQPVVGSFIAGPIEFPKEGEWKLNVTLKGPNDTPETETMDVKVPGSKNGGK